MASDPLSARPVATVAGIATTSGLGGVACPSTSLCFAFGYAGQLFASVDPAGAASSWQVLYAEHAQPTGLACPALTPCIAVDNSGELLVGPSPSTATSG